jgi:hypothetical protein
LVLTALAEMVVGGMATCAGVIPTQARKANNRTTRLKKPDLLSPTIKEAGANLLPSKKYIFMRHKSALAPRPPQATAAQMTIKSKD